MYLGVSLCCVVSYYSYRLWLGRGLRDHFWYIPFLWAPARFSDYKFSFFLSHVVRAYPRSNPRCVFWQTSYLKWSLAPQQIVQQSRTFLDGGVLGPLGSLRSASCQQPQPTWLCIYLASFKLLLLRLRSRQPCITTGGHMTLLVSSLQWSTSFHKKFWNLPDGDYCIRNSRSRRWLQKFSLSPSRAWMASWSIRGLWTWHSLLMQGSWGLISFQT